MSWRAILNAQHVYEEDGARAGLEGRTRADCPYDRARNPTGWNFWVYGCENAAEELAIINSGVVKFYTMLDLDNPVLVMPVREAIASGRWTPKWAKP